MNSIIVEQFTPAAVPPVNSVPLRPRQRLDATGSVMPWAADAATGARAEILARDFADIAPPSVPEEFDVEVTAIRDETPSMSTLVLRRTDGRPFTHRAGQFVRLGIPVDGPDADPVDRCYSVSSSPVLSVYGDRSTFTVCVRKVPGGRVSGWIHEQLSCGTTLEARGPLGSFHLPDVDRRARYLLFAAGAGITPVLSMVRTLATLPGPVNTVVVYHARTPLEFAFATELRDLADRTPGLTLCMSLGTLTPDSAPGWPGSFGRLCPDTVEQLTDDSCGRRVFACGPPGYLATARRVATDLGVPWNAFHEETFNETTTSVDPGPEQTPAPVTDVPVVAHPAPGCCTVTFHRSGGSIDVAPGETLLDAGRRAGVPLRSNCGNGVCGSCAVQKLAGSVDMDDHGGLRQREIDAGKILLCCSRPAAGTAGESIVLDC
jgi:ferredoxin-NADP reductase